MYVIKNAKCKEQMRLVRQQPSEDGTIISLPKRGVTVSTESAAVQTDPIADKGFGVSFLHSSDRVS